MKIQYVRDTFANLWLHPEKVREVDRPSLHFPMDRETWLDMGTENRLDLVGRLESQVLYGAPVQVIEEQEGWARVCVPGQFTPKDPNGYPGWIPASQLTFDPKYHQAWEDSSFAWVTADRSRLLLDSDEEVELSFMTRLPQVEEGDGEVIVWTPDGRTGRIPAKEVTVTRQLPVTGVEARIRTAERFLGLPYLWAGMSSFGFDCSGLMYRIFEANGIAIPRDADPQARYGQRVSKEELAPGDLLFFAYEEGKGSIHHVGMYIGDGAFIHSPNTPNSVKINRLTDEPYQSEWWGSTRYKGGESFT
ncbi:cell wall-associated NlpC family hydrolase [Kroppenstedtia sanguinis]|uniref:C40 family peptidase n=1 Tax=Kroppenstedtia sanguinis TaxID=1380684 RepID=UPI003D2191EE